MIVWYRISLHSCRLYHRQTIRTVRGNGMSSATCDPIHLLYFVTRTRSVKMLHKTQNSALFDPKCWYNVRKVNRDNLPYIFSVVFCVFVAFSVVFSRGCQFQATENALKSQNTTLKKYGKLSLFIFLTLYQNLGSKGARFCVLWSISTNHLKQAECGRYEIK